MSRKPPASDGPRLDAGRLELRPLSADETGSLHRISNEPDVRRYLWDGQPVSEATIRDLIAQSDRMFFEEGVGVFGIRMRGRVELLGFCGFVRLGSMKEPELLYELTGKAWGRGLATEAARACVRYALEEVGMERVIAGADAPNAASLRVLQKLGMKCVGNINPGAPDVPYFALYSQRS